LAGKIIARESVSRFTKKMSRRNATGGVSPATNLLENKKKEKTDETHRKKHTSLTRAFIEVLKLNEGAFE